MADKDPKLIGHLLDELLLILMKFKTINTVIEYNKT